MKNYWLPIHRCLKLCARLHQTSLLEDSGEIHRSVTITGLWPYRYSLQPSQWENVYRSTNSSHFFSRSNRNFDSCVLIDVSTGSCAKNSLPNSRRLPRSDSQLTYFNFLSVYHSLPVTKNFPIVGNHITVLNVRCINSTSPLNLSLAETPPLNGIFPDLGQIKFLSMDSEQNGVLLGFCSGLLEALEWDPLPHTCSFSLEELALS